MKSKYSQGIFNEYMRYYSSPSYNVVDWDQGFSNNSILIYLDDGRILEYNRLHKNVRLVITDPDSEEEWKHEFGIRVRNKMNDAYMNQSKLSKAVGISGPALNKYIKGRYDPSLYMIAKIAKVLNCTVSNFVSGI